jgi:hypothetical protein
VRIEELGVRIEELGVRIEELGVAGCAQTRSAEGKGVSPHRQKMTVLQSLYNPTLPARPSPISLPVTLNYTNIDSTFHYLHCL